MAQLLRKIGPPVLSLAFLLVVWHASVIVYDVKPFVLPLPQAVFEALIANGWSLILAGLETLKIAGIAVIMSIISGVILAFLFSFSRILERALSPLTVILQVTPIVSVAPLILIWTGIDGVDTALILIAWLAAFFPILSTMRAGLNEVDPRLKDLFDLYQIRGWQRFQRLILPSLLPFMLAGLRVSAALALVGTVVAEFVAGSGGATGLAWRILEAGNRLQVDKMFAGLFLLAAMGLGLYYMLAALDRFLLRNR